MKIEFTELGRHEGWLRLSAIVKAGDKHIQLERKLTSELIKNWRESYEDALQGLFKQIPEELSQSVIELITSRLSEALGQLFGSSQKVREELRKYITRAYEGGKSEFAVKHDLSLPDIRAIDVLTKHNCYWLGEHYDKHIREGIAKLTQQAISDGLGRKELAKELREALGGKVGGYKYWDVVSSAALVRSRSFGCISGMVEARITEYEILAMGDERMCPICGELNGQTFSVSETKKVIDRTLDISDPDKFKEAMPWHTESPAGVSKDKLIADGMSIPPFHGRCRCVLTMAETVQQVTEEMLPSSELDDVKPSSSYLSEIASNRRFALEEIEDATGIKITEADKKEAQEKIKELLKSDDTHIGIKFELKNLAKILESGRFKSQFETITSGGMLDLDERARFENQLMSYAKDIAPELRPVYGMLFHLQDVSKVRLTNPIDDSDMYGNVVAFLKPDIKRYATFTGGDSLDNEGRVIASPVLSPSVDSVEVSSQVWGRLFGAIKAEEEVTLSHLGYSDGVGESYIEAQIHGGHATVDQIDHIVFGRDIPDKRIPKELLKEHNISWSREE